jgi:hypothetical protein
LKELNGTVFKHTIAGNRLKPFRVRQIYGDVHSGQETTTIEEEDEIDDTETENEAAALEIKGGEIEGDEAYIPEDRSFAVVI